MFSSPAPKAWVVAPPRPSVLPDIKIPDKLPPLDDPFWKPYRTSPTPDTETDRPKQPPPA